MDIDGDGIIDLLSGSYSRTGEQPMAGLFQVMKGQSGSKFDVAKTLKGTDGAPLIIPFEGDDKITETICTRPSAVDWDSDGDLDLIVGNFKGTFYLFEGEGKGKFAPKPRMVKTGKAPLQLAQNAYHSDPFPIDWDGDGDIDLLSGTANGGVQWAENAAGKGKQPVFDGFQALIAPGKAFQPGAMLAEEDLKGPAGSTRVWSDDVNGDGKLDLLVGDTVTLVSKADGLSDKQFEEKKQAWDKENQAVMKDYQSDDFKKQQAAGKKLNELHQRRSKFMKEDRTGFVWLYVQK